MNEKLNTMFASYCEKYLCEKCPMKKRCDKDYEE